MELSRSELWDLHGRMLSAEAHAVERQWDVTRFFVLLNASLIGAGLALLQLSERAGPRILLVIIFLGGVALCAAGRSAMRESKRYYRTLVAKRVLVEERLGLTAPLPGREADDVANLSVGALATREKLATILRGPTAYASGPVRPTSATGWAGLALGGMAAFDLAAATVVALRLM